MRQRINRSLIGGQQLITASSASGINTVVDAQLNSGASTWPQPATTDPYFNYVPLLLNTTTTNAAQNNTFLDSSTNAFTITRTGTPTQGSVTPYQPSGYWSGYFGATGQYLSVSYSSAFNLIGDFTVECWINCGNLPSTTGSAAQSYERIFSFGNYNAANSFGLEINSNDSSQLRKFFSWYNGTGYPLSSNNAIVPNAWYHLALVRSGTTITFYLNGVSTGTITGASAAVNTSQAFYIATLQGYENDASAAFNGYISNFRICKGVAVYTGAFTPPTAPLAATQSAGTNIAAITGTATSLLTCQSNRFIDNSSNTFTITVNGSASIQAFQPFLQPISYSPIAFGGSGYFGTNGDRLDIATTTAFSFGTGDFTVEGWVYTGTATVCMFDARSGVTATPWVLNVGTGSNTYWYDGTSYTSSVPCVANAWNHVAVSRTSGVLKIFVNGAQGYSNAYTTNLDRTAGLRIGDVVQTGQNWTGYFGQLRIVKGTGVYPSAFTPPTTPLTAISGTSLLTNFTNAGIYDAAWQNNALTVGDAQVSITQYKWGTTSMKFDGTGDYLNIPSSQGLNLGTGSLTVEAWVYLSAMSGDYFIVSSTGVGGGFFGFRSGTDIGYGRTGIAWDYQAASGMVINNWYHVALSRNGTSMRIFVNGSQVGATQTTSQAYDLSTTSTAVGSAGATLYLNGYIQDLRITRGIGRYTANFSVPTAAFPTYGSNILAVDYLVVAGGGGGGSWNAGGGGAGGYLSGTTYSLSTAIAYSVTVGGGGNGGVGGASSTLGNTGSSGSSSIFFSVSTVGGGGGGAYASANPNSGGSGGGAGAYTGVGTGGSGTTGQGFAGGSNNNVASTPPYAGAGGGGAGAVGQSANPGAGGNGVSSSITGTSVTYAGGGGGGGNSGSGAGGTGGGGAGVSGIGTGTAGTANTGGGGGGGGGTSNGPGGAGGSGIIVLRIPSRYTATFSVGLTTTSSTSVTGYTIYNVTNGTGTVTFN
jgi:hypothetical protein